MKASAADIRKSVCVRLRSESSEPTILFSQTTPDEHPPTPPPCRWPALITSPTLAKFQLAWRRLCDAVLVPSCLVKHGLTDAHLFNRVSFSSYSSGTLYSSASFEGPILPPPCLASSLLHFLLRPICFDSSFLPCLTSSALPRFPPPCLPPHPSSVSPPGRAAMQAAGI